MIGPSLFDDWMNLTSDERIQLLHDSNYPEGDKGMIDTDKYEGYSKGEWKIVEGAYADKDGKHEQIWGQPIHHMDLGMFFLDTDFNNDIPKEIQQRRIEARLNGQRDEEAETEANHWADAYVDEWIDEIGKNLLLAQDAPLLLAEVEQLREEKKVMLKRITDLEAALTKQEVVA